jgi:hypothetical protein
MHRPTPQRRSGDNSDRRPVRLRWDLIVGPAVDNVPIDFEIAASLKKVFQLKL